MPKIDVLTTLSKESKQKIVCAFLITLGITLTICAVLIPGAEVMLAFSVPIGAAGLAILGSILDPRDRYIVSNTTNNITTIAGHENTQEASRLRSILFSKKSKEIVSENNNETRQENSNDDGAGVGNSKRSTPPSSEFHSCFDDIDFNLSSLFGEEEEEEEESVAQNIKLIRV